MGKTSTYFPGIRSVSGSHAASLTRIQNAGKNKEAEIHLIPAFFICIILTFLVIFSL